MNLSVQRAGYTATQNLLPYNITCATSDIDKNRALALQSKDPDNHKARNELLMMHLKDLENIAGRVKARYNLPHKISELESAGWTKILELGMWQNYNDDRTNDPSKYIRRCIYTAMIDMLRKENRFPVPVSQLEDFDPDRNAVTSNQTSSSNPKTEEDLRTILVHPAVQRYLSKRNNQVILELTYGVDLGSGLNPEKIELPTDKIAKILGMNPSSVKTARRRTIQKIRQTANRVYKY